MVNAKLYQNKESGRSATVARVCINGSKNIPGLSSEVKVVSGNSGGSSITVGHVDAVSLSTADSLTGWKLISSAVTSASLDVVRKVGVASFDPTLSWKVASYSHSHALIKFPFTVIFADSA